MDRFSFASSANKWDGDFTYNESENHQATMGAELLSSPFDFGITYDNSLGFTIPMDEGNNEPIIDNSSGHNKGANRMDNLESTFGMDDVFLSNEVNNMKISSKGGNSSKNKNCNEFVDDFLDDDDCDSDINMENSTQDNSEKSPMTISLSSFLESRRDGPHESLLEYLEASFSKKKQQPGTNSNGNMNSTSNGANIGQHNVSSSINNSYIHNNTPSNPNIHSSFSISSSQSTAAGNQDNSSHSKDDETTGSPIDPVYLQGLGEWIGSAKVFFDEKLQHAKARVVSNISLPSSSESLTPLLTAFFSVLDKLSVNQITLDSVKSQFDSIELILVWLRWQLQLPEEVNVQKQPKKSSSSSSSSSSSPLDITAVMQSRMSFKVILKIAEKCYFAVMNIMSLFSGMKSLNEVYLSYLRAVRASVLFHQVLGHIIVALPSHRLPVSFQFKSCGLSTTLSRVIIESIQRQRVSLGSAIELTSSSNESESRIGCNVSVVSEGLSQMSEPTATTTSTTSEVIDRNYVIRRPSTRVDFRDEFSRQVETQLLDLLSLCVGNELLASCGLSPLTGQKFAVRRSSRNSSQSSRSVSSSNDSSYGSQETSPDGESEAANTIVDEASTTTGSLSHASVDSNHRRESTSVADMEIKLLRIKCTMELASEAVDLIALLPSPSIVRAKLCFSACKFLETLCRGALVWQAHSIFPNVTRAVIQAEKSIVEHFASAFESTDENRLSQLLMFEAAADTFPVGCSNPNLTGIVESLSCSELWVNLPWAMDISVKTALHAVFQETSDSMGCDSLEECDASGIYDNSFNPRSSSADSDMTTMRHLTDNSNANNNANNDLNVSKASKRVININDLLANDTFGSNVDTLAHNKDTSSILFTTLASHISLFESVDSDIIGGIVLRGLAQSIMDSAPEQAILIMEMQLLLYLRLANQKMIFKTRKELAFLSSKLSESEIAVRHGLEVMDLISDDDFNELAILCDVLVTQFCQLGRHECAILLLQRTIHTIIKKPSVTMSVSSSASTSSASSKNTLSSNATTINSSNTNSSGGSSNNNINNNTNNNNNNSAPLELQRNLCCDPLRLKLGQVHLNYGQPEKAVDVLQQLMEQLNMRSDSVSNLSKKIAVLSWLLKGYLELENADVCKKIIVAIKNIRVLKSSQSVHSGNSGSSSGNVQVDSRSNHNHSSHTNSNNNNQGSNNHNNNNNNGVNGISTALAGLDSIAGHRKKSSPIPSHLHRVNSVVLESNLPVFCVSSHNADLGEAISRVYFQSKLYVSALKSLTPTIIGAELTVGGKNGPRAGQLELARLYYLRGKIQYEASRSNSKVKFPFVVGSAQLFTAVFVLFDAENGSRKKKKRQTAGVSGIGNRNAMDDDDRPDMPSNLTCRRAKRYCTPADLLWDAMKWFRRAWTLFNTVGDLVSAAKSVNYIARCHLEPIFVPHIFFQTPLDHAANLGIATPMGSLSSNASGGPSQGNHSHLSNNTNSKSSSTNSAGLVSQSKLNNNNLLNSNLISKNHPINRAQPHKAADITIDFADCPTGTLTSVQNRRASLEEIQNVMHFAMDVSMECCIPTIMLDSYLNMAELRLLQRESFESVAFWWEARDLFMHLYVNGTQIPLLRRGDLRLARSIVSILERLVRFLLACEQQLINQNLVLLDILLLSSHEVDRLQRQLSSYSRNHSKGLDSLINYIRTPNDSPSNGGMMPPSGSKGSGDPSNSSGLSSSSVARAGSSNSSDPSMNSSGSIGGVGNTSTGAINSSSIQSNGNGNNTITGVNSNTSSSESGYFSSILSSRCIGDESSRSRIFNFRKDPMSGSWNTSTTLSQSTFKSENEDALEIGDPRSLYSFAFDEPSLDCNESNIGMHAQQQQQQPNSSSGSIASSSGSRTQHVAMVTSTYGPSQVLNNDSIFIENTWRCITLLRLIENSYRNGKFVSNELRNKVRKALRTLSFTMRRLRSLDRQLDARDLSYDELVRFARTKTVSTTGGAKASPTAPGTSSNVNNIGNSTTPASTTTKSAFSFSLRSSSTPSETSSAASTGEPTVEPRKAVSLYDRLNMSVYCLHIGQLLLLYRPTSGATHAQLFGSVDFITYKDVTQALLPLQNKGQVSNGVASNVQGSAGVSATQVGGATIAPSVHSNFTNPSYMPTNNSNNGDSFGFASHNNNYGSNPNDAFGFRSDGVIFNGSVGSLGGELYDTMDDYNRNSRFGGPTPRNTGIIGAGLGGHNLGYGNVNNVNNANNNSIGHYFTGNSANHSTNLSGAGFRNANTYVSGYQTSPQNMHPGSYHSNLLVNSSNNNSQGDNYAYTTGYVDHGSHGHSHNNSHSIFGNSLGGLLPNSMPGNNHNHNYSSSSLSVGYSMSTATTAAGAASSSVMTAGGVSGAGVGSGVGSGNGSGGNTHSPPSLAGYSALSESHSSSSSTSSVMLPEAAFAPVHTQFLFEVACEANESDVGGGVSTRRGLVEGMRQGILKRALHFLKEVESELISEETTSSAPTFGKRVTTEDSRYKALLPTGLLKIFRPAPNASTPPQCPIPLTLLASKSLQALPWEILSDLRVIRQISATHMRFHCRVKSTTGPELFQAPLYLGVAQGLTGLPTRLSGDLKSRDGCRRAAGMLRALGSLNQSVGHLVKAARHLVTLPAPSKGQMSVEAMKKYSGICEGFQDRTWPSPSPLLPLGKTSSQSLRSRRLRKFTFLDLGSHDRNLMGLSQWVDSQLSAAMSTTTTSMTMGSGHGNASNAAAISQIIAMGSSTHFPVLLMAYSDLWELGETVLHLLSHRGDAVLVFAPQCYIGTAAKELVRSLDTWCNGDLDGTTKDGSHRTYAYHAVMDAMARMTEESSLPLAVFV